MYESITTEQNRDFEDRGRRWARCMLHHLQRRWLEVPLVWAGTREQAETIVHAFTAEALSEGDEAHLVEVVQSGARIEWSDLIRQPGSQEAKFAARS
jgi:alkylhydroperoxidase family enzyme